MVTGINKKLPGWDLLILTAMTAGCVCAYCLIIGPNLKRAGNRDLALDVFQARETTYKAARLNHARIRSSLSDLVEQVEQEGGGMPSLSGLNQRIATITSIAQNQGLVVEEVAPGQTVPVEDHLQTTIHFQARGEYPEFRRFLKNIEEQMHFVDQTNFSLSAAAGAKNGECRVSWWVRMYSRSDDAPQPQQEDEQAQNPDDADDQKS